MIRTPILLALVAASALAGQLPAAEPGDTLGLTVKAGAYPRKDSPVRFDLDEARLGPAVRKALDAGTVGLTLFPADASGVAERPIHQVAQVDRVGEGRVRATFVLPTDIPIGGEARFLIARLVPAPGRSAWSLSKIDPPALELKHGDRSVFRYNASPVSSPNYKEIQNRDGYLHPAYSPSGALVTGDFSTSHPHHRGFFLAYEKTKIGDLAPDFWNIHLGTGKIHADGLGASIVGPVTARFSADHRWEAKDKASGKGTVVLRERWDVEAIDVPGAPYWLFDLTSTQRAVDRPVELLPYRYGGMAYRGPEPFVKGTLDVLTSDGKHRRDGDQKVARWVDLTGPIADGSNSYAGAMIADHPGNPHAPSVARIHPTTLPFFCFVPAYQTALTVATDTPTTFRYRVLIHDGHPDAGLDERTWRDFADPPPVTLDP